MNSKTIVAANPEDLRQRAGEIERAAETEAQDVLRKAKLQADVLRNAATQQAAVLRNAADELTRLQGGEVKRGPGRPKGSKNKNNNAVAQGKRGPGRPKGSTNKPKEEKRGPGRPKGSTNKSKAAEVQVKRGPGRPRKDELDTVVQRILMENVKAEPKGQGLTLAQVVTQVVNSGVESSKKLSQQALSQQVNNIIQRMVNDEKGVVRNRQGSQRLYRLNASEHKKAA